jgi:hypothetical protein
MGTPQPNWFIRLGAAPIGDIRPDLRLDLILDAPIEARVS